MYVKMLKPNLVYSSWREAGEVVDVHDERAREMIGDGHAVPSAPPARPEIQTAALRPEIQTAALKPRKRRAKGAD